jgi:hypothetical protein
LDQRKFYWIQSFTPWAQKLGASFEQDGDNATKIGTSF